MKFFDKQKIPGWIIAAAVVLAGVVLILLHSLRPYREEDPGTGFSSYKRAYMFRPDITANPGGKIPTAVPTITPTSLDGMDSPAFCKLEMLLLHNKAEEAGGGGMLIPDRYEQADQACVFAVRDKNTLQEIGHLRVVHKENNGYGIHVEISDNAGRPRTGALLFWGTAALSSFDNKFTQAEARRTVQEAIDQGTASLSVYELSCKQNVLDRTTVISIIDSTKNQPEPGS